MGKLLNLNRLILMNLIVSIFFFNKCLFSQSFEIPNNYIEAPLIYSHETILTGIIKIVPVAGPFSKYSYIELSKVNGNIRNPFFWLEDKIFDELGNIAEMERLLRSDDSPLSDPVFEQFKNIPLHVNDTLEQLAINPLTFCNDITKPYNLEGSFYELDCTIPFGFFNKYLILRLQYADEIWYFKKLSSLSYKRIKMLINIAETFKGN